MKKLISLVLALVLLCSTLPLSAAALPPVPTVKSSVKDCTYSYYTDHDVILTARFTAPEGCQLKYQWYVADENLPSKLVAIPDATEKTYEPPVEIGVKYYCVAAWSEKDGEESAPVYDRMARVEFTSTTVKVESMSLAAAPHKLTYFIGETLDLTGMHVIVSSGFDIYDSYDGSGIIITTSPFRKEGTVKIPFTYGNGTVTGYITVEVLEMPEIHTHSFGDWQTLTEPNCGVNGLRIQRCDCGEENTQTLPATGEHNWQKVSIDNGVTTYKCSDCQGIRTEGTPIVPPASEPQEQGGDNTPAPESESRFPWWILIVVLVLVLAVGGFYLYLRYLELQRKQKKAARKRPGLPE